MRLRFLHIALALCLAAVSAAAQDYTQTPVTVSTQKVRLGGKVYLSHVVQEKQTLYSIARAYGVTVDDICAANPDMNLKEDGLKLNAILLIPYVENRQEPSESPQEVMRAPDDGYIIHTVRWYEDIDSIAKKYGMEAERILEYNGLTSRKLKSRMKLRIPTGDASAAELPPPAPDSLATAPADTAAQTAPVDSTDLEDLLSVIKRKEKVNALLILPFGAETNPSETSMDFYSGFLLGIRDLGRKEGISTDLSVYDLTGGSLPITAAKMAASDIVIGPVSPSDVKKVLSVNLTGTPVVSPLDSRTAALVGEYKSLIHAPTPAEVQYEEAVRWIGEDLRPTDKVLVISEEGGSNQEITAMVDTLLQIAAIPHTMFSYGLLRGRRVADELKSLGGEGTMRVIITSDSEAFVTDAVRNLVLLQSHHKNDVVLYSSSKIRNFTRIEVESLHKLNLHAAVSYHIDYDSPAVRDFVMAYRALFNCEPTQFSFQGYDIATFFIRSCCEGGNRWFRRLTAVPSTRTLQTDFLLSREDEGGLVNTAVRRVVYTPDYRITLL